MSILLLLLLNLCTCRENFKHDHLHIQSMFCKKNQVSMKNNKEEIFSFLVNSFRLFFSFNYILNDIAATMT